MTDKIVKPGTGKLNIGPMGFILYAEDFLYCFNSYNSEKPFSPAKYYLVCRSIELAMKSYLSLKKVGNKEIKNKLRHDLSKILDKISELKIDKVFKISETEMAEIRKANDWYNRKGFEYFDIKNIVESKKTLPDLDLLQA